MPSRFVSTSYKLKFLPSALKEWRKLSSEIGKQFSKKLAHIIGSPHVPAARIRGYKQHYQIKLRSVGYRLVYEVDDNEIIVYVICVGRRDTIYKILKERRN